MKQFFLKSLFIILPGVLLLSCDKESELNDLKPEESHLSKEGIFTDENDYSKLSITNGVLDFKSYEYYESLINSNKNVHFLTQYISRLSFESYGKYHNDIEDEFLATMLDKNQIVKIGKWYIKVNMQSEMVLASSELDGYNIVLNNKEQDKLYTFSTSEDVFDYLNNSELLHAKGLFCNDPKADKKESAIPEKSIPGTYPYVNGFMKGKIKYVKAGIYYALRAEMWHTLPHSKLNYWFQLESCDYAQRCGSSISNYSHPWITPPSSTVTPLDEYEKYKFYSGVKQLKSYDFKVRIRCESSQNAWPNPYNVYFTNWAQISD